MMESDVFFLQAVEGLGGREAVSLVIGLNLLTKHLTTRAYIGNAVPDNSP